MYNLSSRIISSFNFCTIAEPKLLKLGDKLNQIRVFTNSDVVDYSNVAHDFNPLHFDPQFARTAGFDGAIVHGMLVSSLFPRIISTHFPGAVYTSQSLQFKQPVYVGEDIAVEVEAINIRDFKKKFLVKFSTRCLKQEGNLVVLDGEATTILPTLRWE